MALEIMLEVLLWIANRWRRVQVTQLALLLAGAIVVAWGLQSIVRGFDPGLAVVVGVLAVVVGWLLAHSPLPSALGAGLYLLIGIEFIVWRIGNLTARIVAAVVELSRLLWQFRTFGLGAEIDVRPAEQAILELARAVLVVLARVAEWTNGLVNSTPAYDPVAIVALWSYSIWLVAGWSAWSLCRRKQPLEATLPSMVLLAALVAFEGSSTWSVIVMLALTLCLMIIIAYDVRKKHWDSVGMEQAEDIATDLAAVGLPLAFLIVSLAAMTPSLSLQDFARAVQERMAPTSQSNALPGSLGLVFSPSARTTFDQVRSPGLPRMHLLGSSQELSKQVVMTIQTLDKDEEEGGLSGLPNHYWRGVTYDRYTGSGWNTEWMWMDDYRAGEAAAVSMEAAHRLTIHQVQVFGQPDGFLYAPGNVISADQDYSIARRSSEDVFGAITKAGAYRVQSVFPVTTENQLREAGANYPAWVRERYLALPESMPQRVHNLALDLTATERTPYDRARAIESYLHSLPYSLQVPAPPLRRDVVDYFLFDLRKGYCDYFASAMVVLSRAAGVPARLVVGYAPGAFDSEKHRFVVTKADAHSWAEVYFPGYGWTEFEPTSSRQLISRPDTSNLMMSTEREDPASSIGVLAQASRYSEGVRLIFAGLGLLAAGFTLVVYADDWHLYRLAPEAALKLIYRRQCRLARFLSVPTQAHYTPNEIARLATEQMETMSRGRWMGSLLRSAPAMYDRLTDLYVRSCYGGKSIGETDRRQALEIWRRMRVRLSLALVWQFVRSMPRPRFRLGARSHERGH